MIATLPQSQPAPRRRAHPLLDLHEDDLDFMVQFVLASGSLKEMAQLYGVSYPTIRSTLDRVIGNLQRTLSGQTPDPMTELLAGLIERGEIKPATAKSIRAVHRSVVEQSSHRRNPHE